MTIDLKKIYDREYELLKDTLDTILSELELAQERLARMELLKELERKTNEK